MDDLDRLVAETMHAAAGHAPTDDGLLGKVHRRSARRRRRHIAGLSAVVALVVGIPLVVALLTGTPGSPEPMPPATVPVRLSPGYTGPVFPYTLPPTAGMKAPVASMQGGNLIAFFEAAELRHHADTTVTVSSGKPALTGAPVQVRGHTGTFRTVEAYPAKQLTLYWPESPGRWIQIATDDTYTEHQVIALAGALTAASVPILPPFRLDLSPAGLAPDTVTASRMRFRGPAGELEVVLRKRQPLARSGELTGDAARRTLTVDVPDWDATLVVTSSLGLTDADLRRFADGVHILDRSDPE
jgi:hypothetical protein